MTINKNNTIKIIITKKKNKNKKCSLGVENDKKNFNKEIIGN